MITESKLNSKSLKIAQKAAHRVWEKYDDTYGYRTEKQTRNAQVKTNHPDNIWFFVNQFDTDNQVELLLNILMEPQSKARDEVFNFVGEYLKEVGEEVAKLREKFKENVN